MTELEFGERLKQYRKARGLTQQELADLLGVSNKSVSRWESGSYPDVATLGPLAHALGVTVDDLLGVAPPLRSLGRADWQNWLSFAFAIAAGCCSFCWTCSRPPWCATCSIWGPWPMACTCKSTTPTTANGSTGPTWP